MSVLVTGGAGYIGSHTCVELLNAGESVVILDNFSNSKPEVLDKIRQITGKDFKFYEVDLVNELDVKRDFDENPDIDVVIHFAGLKAVGESVAKPLEYYQNNITGTLVLCNQMRAHGVKKIVFSSSATVYGSPKSLPIKEDFPLSTTNPYGTTKLMIERILTDCANADQNFHPVLLRYFNPVGAHESGKIGEDPNGIPNNLVPYITQTVVGKREKVHVFGNDYPTPDGTGVRDYIHVVDLAKGHAAVLPLFEKGFTGAKVYNLGTGKGYSVLDMIHAFSKAAGKDIPYVIDPRRPGDIPECYADCSKAYEELGWKAEKTLDDMCADSLRWQRMNPNGFED